MLILMIVCENIVNSFLQFYLNMHLTLNNCKDNLNLYMYLQSYQM